jgi:hypothetical protein
MRWQPSAQSLGGGGWWARRRDFVNCSRFGFMRDKVALDERSCSPFFQIQISCGFARIRHASGTSADRPLSELLEVRMGVLLPVFGQSTRL